MVRSSSDVLIPPPCCKKWAYVVQNALFDLCLDAKACFAKVFSYCT